MKKPSRKKWWFPKSDIDNSLAIASELGISLLTAQLLTNRGIKTAAEAQTYLYPTFDQLHDPFKFAGMHKAIERIHKAIALGEKIYIYGDYDTDGTTATALLLNTFRHMDVPADYYIPNRFEEGYGLSEGAVKKIHEERDAKLIVTVDCGITSVKEVALANQLGIDVIITDHHQPEAEQPPAYALISPKIPGNEEYPYDELAGVGLAFKLAQGLIDDRAFLESLLDLVVLGTVVDVAPLSADVQECMLCAKQQDTNSTNLLMGTRFLLSWGPASMLLDGWTPLIKRLNCSPPIQMTLQHRSLLNSIRQIRNGNN